MNVVSCPLIQFIVANNHNILAEWTKFLIASITSIYHVRQEISGRDTT